MSRITILEHCLADRILISDGVLEGVEALDSRTNTKLEFTCRFLILATGGAGQLFKVSTNPEVATGDGVALAYRAGAEIADMEFFQFHPTALRLPGVPPFLISEAVRGEGGILRNAEGRAFMPDYHPQADLAPRDVVARAIVTEMEATGTDHVFLDVTHLPPSRVTARFPQIYRFCLDHGLDITREPIPVSPAAHYMMGGVRTNTWGETNLRGLYACGEVACTGVHGANRLASNSLLETVVFGKRVVERTLQPEPSATEPTADAIALSEPVAARGPAAGPGALQTLMWEKVGIVRDGASLSQAKALLAAWQATLPAPSRPPLARAGEPARLRPADDRGGAPARGEPRRPLSHRLPGAARGVATPHRLPPPCLRPDALQLHPAHLRRLAETPSWRTTPGTT